METNPLTHAGKTMADLLAENAQLREIEAANKETIEYWRRQCYKLEKMIKRLRVALIQVRHGYWKAHKNPLEEINKIVDEALAERQE